MSYLTFKFWSIIQDAQVNHIYMQHQKGGNFFLKFELRSCKRTFDTLMIFFPFKFQMKNTFKGILLRI